jgi:hypothetical protein
MLTPDNVSVCVDFTIASILFIVVAIVLCGERAFNNTSKTS